MTARTPGSRSTGSPHRTGVVVVTTFLFLTAAIASARADDASPPAALSVEQAVRRALDGSADLQSARDDWKSAVEKAIAAKLQMLPSLSLNGVYTRLSHLDGATVDIPFGGSSIPVQFPSSPDNAITFTARLQYPVFAGFRLLQAARIAELTATAKNDAIAVYRNALAFETQRAYWEAVRATANVETLKKNLDLTTVLQREVQAQVSQGVATASDRLSVDEQVSQAQVSLESAISMRNQAYMSLAALFGDAATADNILTATLAGTGSDAADALPYRLVSSPGNAAADVAALTANPAGSVAEALGARNEVHAAEMGVQMAEHAVKAAAGGLYPSVAVVGDYTYANPNQRVFPATDSFTGTWDIGVQISLDVGGAPANLARTAAAQEDLARAKEQLRKQSDSVRADVRSTLLALDRASHQLTATQAAVAQADESLRVGQQMFDNGLAKHSDVLKAQLGVLRAQLAVTNAEVSLEIDEADFRRAAGRPAEGWPPAEG